MYVSDTFSLRKHFNSSLGILLDGRGTVVVVKDLVGVTLSEASLKTPKQIGILLVIEKNSVLVLLA